MIVTKNVDNLGRIVIPNDYKKVLNIKNGDEINIELNDDKIIITKAKNERMERIKNKLEDVKKNYEIATDKEFYNGYIKALEWLLEEE